MGVLKNFGPILKSQKRLIWVSKCRFLVILPPAVILLQIVMVSPGTHLVKSYESQSRTNESKLKKRVRNWKCLGLYVTEQSEDRIQNSVSQYTEIKI